MIDIREKYLDLDSIHIQAMPLDDRAREAVKEMKLKVMMVC